MVRPYVDIPIAAITAGIPQNFSPDMTMIPQGIFDAVVFANPTMPMVTDGVSSTVNPDDTITVSCTRDMSSLTLRVHGYMIDE